MTPLDGTEYTLTAGATAITLDSELGLRLMEMLGATTWARGLSHGEVKAFTAFLGLYSFKKGAAIFAEGDLDCSMALVLTGRIEIRKGHDASNPELVELDEIGPGQVFGEMAMLDGQPRSASARAKEDVLLAVLLEERYQDLCAGDPALALKLTRNIARVVSLRLRRTSDNLVRYL